MLVLCTALAAAAGCAATEDRRIGIGAESDGGSADTGAPPARTLIIRAVVTRPDCVVAADVTVEAPGADTVRAEYGETAAYGMETSAFAVDATGAARIPLLGLKSNSNNHLRVVAAYTDGTSLASGDRVVATSMLPPEFPRFEVVKAGPGGGFVAMGMTNRWGGKTKALVVSREGRVMWYRIMEDMTPHGLEVATMPGGRLAIYMGQDVGYEEVDMLAGTTVRTWKDTVAERGTNGHEFRWLPNGRVLLLGYGGHTGDDNFDYIDEIDADGRGHFHWQSAPMPSENDVLHANSLDPTADGAILVSLRNTSEVLKIDMATGATLWTLGGEKSDFAFVGDPKGGFSQQHHARMLPDGHVTIFDNGVEPYEPKSRVVEYALDESARTATLAWEHYHDPPVFCVIAGSAVRLAGGNTLVSWGSAVADTGSMSVTEVDPAGNVVWEMASEGFGTYRAAPIDRLYP